MKEQGKREERKVDEEEEERATARKKREGETSRGQKAPPRNFERRRLLRPPFNGDSRGEKGGDRPAEESDDPCKNRKYFSLYTGGGPSRVYSDVLASSAFGERVHR